MSHVLVMCAMEEEATYLRDRMDDCSEVPLTGAMRRTRGTIGGVTVDLVISGIGGVYATMATTAAILDQKPTAVFSCGCSGAHCRTRHSTGCTWPRTPRRRTTLGPCGTLRSRRHPGR